MAANNALGNSPVTGWSSPSNDRLTTFISCSACTDDPTGDYGMKVWIYNDDAGVFTNWANTISISSSDIEQ